MPARVKSRKKGSDDDEDDAYGSDGDTAMPSSPRPNSKGKRKVTQFLVPITNDKDTFHDQRRDRRRSSFRVVPVGDDSEDGPNTTGGSGAPKTPHRRLSQLNVVAQTPALPASIEIMSSNYEEWMKMATDNKINAANSWNFALIDYFADMSLLRNDIDKSINFQKASCTLDGCVKIWTSRVDSVGTATGQLLNNLANEGAEGDGDEDGEDGAPEGGKKRRAHRPESTLSKPQQLRSKKRDLDLDFTVDPLFKKTRADFDEGGAGGLLLNHLGVDGNLRVIFDSGDSNEFLEDEGEERVDLMDLSELRREFFPSLGGLDDLAISHSLEDFSFDKGLAQSYDATFMNESFHDDGQDAGDDDDGFGDTTFPVTDGGGDMPMDTRPDGDGGGAPVEDFFTGDQAVPDYDDFAPPPQDDTFGDNSGDADNTGEGATGASSNFQSFDPRNMPSEREFMLAMANNEESMVDYFDSGFLKNWAGPEHWKVRRAFRKPDQSMADKTAGGAKVRKEKKVFRIDFTAPAEVTTEAMFAPVTKGTGLTLPALARPGVQKAKGKRKVVEMENRETHMLPDDMHFSAKTLISLFLKPKFTLTMRGKGNTSRVADAEVDDQYWARAAAEQAAGRTDGDGDGEAGALPFSTQFFHDDFDDGPGFDDGYEGDAPAGADATAAPEEDLLAASQDMTRRIRPQAINYSKRAKRVDVRKLKENIWKNLDIIVKHEDDDDDDVMQERLPTDPDDAKDFATVVDGLKRAYPRDKMEEISSSFCFICLLHLANEEGLKIAKVDPEQAGERDDMMAPVGDIRSLQVFRDPTATRAA